jgi:type II secretory pathway pseudopilin PulG
MRGISVLECVVVILIIAILATFAVFNSSTGLKNSQADSAMDTLVGKLRMARMTALSQRRNVVVTIDTNFTGPDNAQHLYTQVVALPGEPTQPMDSMELTGGLQFVLEPGVPDTPLHFGNESPIFFSNGSGNSTIMQFTSYGSFTDGNNVPLNGTFFIGVPNTPVTGRAVTIMGGAASIQQFSWSGVQWN